MATRCKQIKSLRLEALAARQRRYLALDAFALLLFLAIAAVGLVLIAP